MKKIYLTLLVLMMSCDSSVNNLDSNTFEYVWVFERKVTEKESSTTGAMNSIKKAWHDFEGAHVVFCLEGRSWRKDYYEPYKRNRKNARDARTEKEVEEDEVFWETFDNFKDFIDQKTNCTVLRHEQLEADDLIAGWVQAHPNDNHFIISTDGDFAQLIAPNVAQYNGVQEIDLHRKKQFL